MVLAHLCHTAQLEFAIAHCNFRLRAAESDGDEEFVRRLAVNFERVCFITHFDTMGYVNKNKVSIEMAARELRYTWFSKIMQQNMIGTLVTAHHADDDLETFIINLSRGTGIDGLTGIPPKTASISRPLLAFSRENILTYARSKNLVWRDDHTNAEVVHLRNKIRHEVVPKFKALHPRALANFKMTRSYLSDTALILENHITELKAKLFENKGEIVRIPVVALTALYPTKAYIHALFRHYNFKSWNDIFDLLQANSGKEVRSKTHRLVKDRDYLLLEELVLPDSKSYSIEENDTEITLPINLRIQFVDSLGERAQGVLYVDNHTLKYPLTVRKWKKGDYFYPFGMTGKKKLSKYFKDEKLDIISKEKQWLLCSGDDIVWVIGKRADNRFKVTKDTQQILKFTWVL